MNFSDIVKVPYTTIPRMQKYEGDLLVQPASQIHLNEKRKELMWEKSSKKFDPSFGLSFASDLARARKLIKKTSNILGFGNINHIVELCSNIQEDLVIVDHGRISAACVCFPSGWNPFTTQGKTLEQIHAPVADGDTLRKMSDKLSQLMCGEHRYHRYVWTVTTNKYLSAHPFYKRSPASSINDLWFRQEHQITFPIQKNYTSGFLIDVSVCPLTFLSNEQQELIRQSINSMSDNVLKYKHLEDIKSIINA
jgi:hypothetical protein